MNEQELESITGTSGDVTAMKVAIDSHLEWLWGDNPATVAAALEELADDFWAVAKEVEQRLEEDED